MKSLINLKSLKVLSKKKEKIRRHDGDFQISDKFVGSLLAYFVLLHSRKQRAIISHVLAL